MKRFQAIIVVEEQKDDDFPDDGEKKTRIRMMRRTMDIRTHDIINLKMRQIRKIGIYHVISRRVIC